MILTPLVAGAMPVRAPLLRLARPISFWGGVDPQTGEIVDARHPDRGARIGGTILALPGTIGSSSSSSVLLELVRVGQAPAALLLAEIDAILLLGQRYQQVVDANFLVVEFLGERPGGDDSLLGLFRKTLQVQVLPLSELT